MSISLETVQYRLDNQAKRLEDLESDMKLVPVLDERVKTMGQEVRGLKRALWGFSFSILGGGVLFLLGILQLQ